MSLTGDPFSALATIIVGIYTERKVQQWISLLFQMGFSTVATFLFICGSSLIASRSWTISIGSGMLSGAITLVIFFRRSPLTKGMMAVLPSAEAQKEILEDIQVIQKTK